jgi:hypothetical protein
MFPWRHFLIGNVHADLLAGASESNSDLQRIMRETSTLSRLSITAAPCYVWYRTVEAVDIGAFWSRFPNKGL